MGNIIHLEKYKRSGEDFQILERENDDFELVEVEFLYDYGATGICGVSNLLDGKKLTSVQRLREQIEEQREIVRTGFDKNGNEVDLDDIDPWGAEGNFIVCEEGIFIWNWEIEDYKLFGEISRIERRIVVHFLEDSVVKIGVGEKFMPILQDEVYFLDGEYVANDGQGKRVVMLVINLIGCVPFAVPYDEETIIIMDQDFAVIDL